MANSSEKILIVDDSEANTVLAQRILRAQGYDADTAMSGQEGLDKLRKESYALLLLDIEMPGMNGFDVMSVIKKDNAFRNIGVIYLSAITAKDTIIQGYETGAIDYITKPFEKRELIARVATHLRLLRQNRELLQLNNIKDKLFSIISHDLKNSFQGVLGLTELTAEIADTLSREEIYHKLQLMREGASRTNILLKSLLEWSRLQSGSIVVRYKTLRPAIIADNAIELYKQVSLEKNIHVQNRVSGDFAAEADADLVFSILRNLVNNAIKYSHPGGAITISGSQQNGYIEIRVQDTGVGMSIEKAASLFSASGQASTEGTAGEKGTGLGLTLVKEFAEIQGGTIRVESELGKGSTFIFTLLESKNTEHTDPSRELEPQKILIVDDEEINRILLQKNLEKQGHTVEVCKDSFSALKKLREVAFQVIITDINMPGMSGYELLAHIMRDPTLANVRLFLLSASETPVSANDSRIGFLPKPFIYADFVVAWHSH